MKSTIAVFILLLISGKGYSQENRVTLSGGYSSTNIENSAVTATGWRINGLYEFNPGLAKISHGISIGYMNVSGVDGSGVTATKSSITSVPVYYVPKFTFGNEKFKGFIKGALGMQFAGLKREGAAVIFSDNDSGFYGGAGTGLMFFIKNNIFISAEYEIAWASNRGYRDGWVSSVMGGIGLKF